MDTQIPGKTFHGRTITYNGKSYTIHPKKTGADDIYVCGAYRNNKDDSATNASASHLSFGKADPGRLYMKFLQPENPNSVDNPLVGGQSDETVLVAVQSDEGKSFPDAWKESSRDTHQLDDWWLVEKKQNSGIGDVTGSLNESSDMSVGQLTDKMKEL